MRRRGGGGKITKITVPCPLLAKMINSFID
jgi:hypothetical protein